MSANIVVAVSGVRRNIIRYARLFSFLTALIMGAGIVSPTAALATDDVIPSAVATTGTLPSFLVNFACFDDPQIIIDNDITMAPLGLTQNYLRAYCPRSFVPADYKIVLSFAPTDQQAMTGMRFWLNAGNAMNDNEPQYADFKVNYVDPITGAPQSVIFDNVFIGDTVLNTVPLDLLFKDGSNNQLYLFGVTSVEMSDLGSNILPPNTTQVAGQEMPIREIHGLFETSDPVTVKSVSPAGPVAVGATVTFTINVSNPNNATNAGLAISNLALTDLLPSGLTPTGTNGTVTRGTYNSTTGVWQIGALLPGQSGTLTLQGTVNAGQEGQVIANTTTRAEGTRHSTSTAGDVLTAQVIVVGANPVTESGNAVAGTASSPIANVAANDKVNGVQATLGVTGNATVAQSGTWPTGITLDTNDGSIDVAATVAPGTYNVTYRLCDKNVPANCNTVQDTIIVAVATDISIAKTNNVTTVTSGSSTTYVINATNNGPYAVTGAIVTDSAGAGITCAPSAPVIITGNGVPAGSYTFSNLSGAGITLGTLANGQSATLTYSCQVN